MDSKSWLENDHHAVIWTRAGGSPVKMANMVLSKGECRITYTDEFIRMGLPGLSLVLDPVYVQKETIVWRSTDSHPFHPRIMTLIPPNRNGNLQRKIYVDMLRRNEKQVATGPEMEWEILLAAGRNGIGHIDVFRSDEEALADYGHVEVEFSMVRGSRSRIWSLLRNEIKQITMENGDSDILSDALGTTPTAGGMISKVLIAIPDEDRWDGRFLLHETNSTHAMPGFVSAIVKIEDLQYEGLADLESLCLDVHREAGFDVPRSWRLDLDDMKLLAVERFDRTPNHVPIPFESLMTLFTSGSKKVQSGSDILWPDVGKYISRLGKISNLDIRSAQETLFRRMAYALMTGNGDMHLDNIGLLGDNRLAKLSPVYDPAPMRAWSRHNMRMAIPMDFDQETPIYVQIAETAPSFGLSVGMGWDILMEAAETTKDYCDRVMALNEVPEIRRKFLVDVVKKERGLLYEACPTISLPEQPSPGFK